MSLDPARWDEWEFRTACLRADEWFLREGELRPLFYAYSGDCLYVLALGMGDEREKAHSLRLAQLFFLAYEVTHYIVAFESWTASLPVGESRSSLPESLEHAPGRQEALVTISVNRRRARHSMRRILRDPLRLEPIEIDTEEGSFGGRFAELLDPPIAAPAPDEIAALKVLLERLGMRAERIDVQRPENPE